MQAFETNNFINIGKFFGLNFDLTLGSFLKFQKVFFVGSIFSYLKSIGDSL